MRNLTGVRIIAGLICLLVCLQSAASIPALANLPTDEVRLGNAYVEAWSAMRMDFDTLSHGDVHPSMLHQWLQACPPNLLKDIATHSADAIVVLAAAKQLVTTSIVDTEFFKRLEHRWHNKSIQVHFSALRVIFGDVAYIGALRVQLKSPSDSIRIRAAGILALAGKKEGKLLLTEYVRSCSGQVKTAAMFMARYGTLKDSRMLEAVVQGGCELPLVQIASGEVLFREMFPLHYQMLRRRDASETRYASDTGMYGAWFMLVRYARQHGIVSSTQFAAFLRQFREPTLVWPQGDRAVYKRHLDAFNGFFNTVEHKLKVKSSRLKWPTSFPLALIDLRNVHNSGFGSRVCAAISILYWTQQKLLLEQMHGQRQYRVLTPKGARIVDGNWSTTWRGRKDEPLKLRWETAVDLRELWVAIHLDSSPVGGKNKKIKTRIELTVGGKAGKQVLTRNVNGDAYYYQKLPIGIARVEDVNIQFVGNEGMLSVPISELRVVIGKSK